MFIYTQNILLILWYSIPLSSFHCIFSQSDAQDPTLLAILLSKASPFSTWCLITIAVQHWGNMSRVWLVDLWDGHWCMPVRSPSVFSSLSMGGTSDSSLPSQPRETTLYFSCLSVIVSDGSCNWCHVTPIPHEWYLYILMRERISFSELLSCRPHPLSGHPLLE